jgi:hypothetical protein
MIKALATKNVAAVLLTLSMVLGFAFVFATPAKADQLSDLQAQVQALLAQISALQGSSSTSSMSSSCFTFTMNHKLGSSGGEVMWIQKFLNGHGFTVASTGPGSPGNETSHFGPATKAAVIKFQNAYASDILTPVGLTMGTGNWGAATRAKANALCVMSTPEPTPGPTPEPTPGPTSTSTPSETLNGTAGSATLSPTTEDVEDQVFTGTTEKVLGFKVEASGGDIRVTNVRVRFTYTGGSTPSDRLADYASEISIWAAGQKIASMSPTDFVRDSAGVYTASIPVSQIVRMGSANKMTFHVGLTANSSIDSDNIAGTWTAAIGQIRYTDSTGVTLFEGNTTFGTITNPGVNVARLSSSSDVKFRMNDGTNNPKAGNVQVSESAATDVTLAEFTLQAQGADMSFDKLTASTTVTGVSNTGQMVQNFYLMRGTTRLAEVTAASTGTAQVVTFTLDSTEHIAKDATQTYKIVAKVNQIGTGSGSPTAFDQGDTITASTSPAVGDINVKTDSDGKTVIAANRTGSVTTYTQSLYSKGIQISKVSEAFTLNAQQTSSASTGEFKATVRVMAFGSDDVYVPLTTLATTSASSGSTKGIAFGMQKGDLTATSTDVSATLTRVSGGSIVTVGGVDLVKISGGQSADLQLTATFNPDASTGTTAQWRMQIWSVGHRADANASTATTIVATTPVENFRTGFYTVNN